jgi:hypothetical protein
MRTVLVTVLIALAVGVPAAAAPAPTFSAPVRLGFQQGDDWEPAVAADRSGHVYAAWSHYTDYAGTGTGEPDPSCPTCASPHTVLQVSNDGGATWSLPRALSPSTTRQDDPQLVVDAADGRIVYAAFMQNNKSSEYVARSDDFGATWKTMLVEPLQRAKLSQYASDYPYKYLTPKDGFAEPYGDYFELDIDGAGTTHAVWGEGPSYVGPGNVWYARGR